MLGLVETEGLTDGLMDGLMLGDMETLGETDGEMGAQSRAPTADGFWSRSKAGGTKRGRRTQGTSTERRPRSGGDWDQAPLQGASVKQESAQDGCLGRSRRRRTWQAAKSLGELQASVDPGMSEWGNPAEVILRHPKGSQPRELKHLSTWRKRNQTRDSLSSGERRGKSPNRVFGPGVVGPQGTVVNG